MTYDTKERSNYDGSPITLYEFNCDGVYWRYAANETAVTAFGETYEPLNIGDDGISQSGDASDDDYKITLEADCDLAQLYVGTPPSLEVLMTVRRMQRGETDDPVVWVGTIKSARRKSLAEVELNCKTFLASLDRSGLRLSWSRGCPHALYDRNCRVDPDDWAVALQIATLNGDRFTATGLSSYAENWFAGGYIEFTSAFGTMERRAVESNSGTMVVLLGLADGMTVGQWVTLYPGCNRTTGAGGCTKFSNLSNYGGFPFMPTKSPFDGDPVF